ncbi:MAG: hypothetical protein DCF29_03745 [Alphaproteobacteria bacterium]|nr:MAG: hypothetical protein DCF29_03745 [Alphaproteobacteria bacterium]
MTRPTLRAQVDWARGMALQHARIAARNAPTSAARRKAQEREAIARAAVRTLEAQASAAPMQEAL